MFKFTRQSIFAVVVLSSIFQPSAFAKKELPEYWKDTGLKFLTARNIVNDRNCYRDKDSFLGCVLAVNSMLAEIKPTPLGLAPASAIADSKKYGAVRLSFGAASIAEVKRDSAEPVKGSLVVYFNKLKQERKETVAAWMGLYAGGKNRLGSFDQVLQWAATQVVTPENEAEVTSRAVNSYLGAAMDPHTYIIPRAYQENQMQSDTDSFVGIGARLKLVGEFVEIQSLTEGGPAALSGNIHALDMITAVDGVATQGLKLDAVIKMIRGEAGSTIRLKLMRAGELHEVTLTRAAVVTRNVVVKILPGYDRAIGYLKLGNFMDHRGCTALQQGVTQLQNANVRGLIFDLRDNGGGLIEQARCITGIFIDAGKAVVTQKKLSAKYGDDETSFTSGPKLTDLPLIVLINGHSASASEITAGALQDYGRAFLLGERSFGKGSVQVLGALAANTAVTFAHTIARFYLPSGRTNQVVGLIPDFEVFKNPEPTEEDKFVEREEDEYLNALPPVGEKWVQTRQTSVTEIHSCAAGRGVAQHVFSERKNADLAPDYQLLVAQDAMACVLGTH